MRGFRKNRHSFFHFLLTILLVFSIVTVALVCSSGDSFLLIMQTKNIMNGQNFDQLKHFSQPEDQIAEATITLDGLDYSLIDQLSDSYVKELLSLYLESSEGKLDSFESHASLTGLLTTQVAATGYYPGTALPLSYLPFKKNKVLWGEEYNGVPAEKMTLANFTSSEYKKIGGAEYNPEMGEKKTKGSDKTIRSPWALTDNIKEVAKISGTGTSDFRYFPNILVHINNRYNSALKTLGISDNLGINSTDSRIGDSILAATLSDGDSKMLLSGYGIIKGSARKLNVDREDTGEMSAKAFNACVSAVSEINQSSIKWKELDNKEFIDASATVIAAHTQGWYLNKKAYDHIDETVLRVWKSIYPDDNVTSVADCKAKAEASVKSLADAITEQTGIDVSEKDTKKVYSTSNDYTDCNDKDGIVFHVSQTNCDVYTNTYEDGTTPFLVSAFSTETAGRIFFSCFYGEYLYVRLLKVGGMADMDFSDPASYKKHLIANNRESNSTGTLAEVFAKTGLKSNTISDKRIAVLNSAASMLGVGQYTWAAGHAGEFGVGDDPPKNNQGYYEFDCSGYVSWCFMKNNLQDYPVSSSGFYSIFSRISAEDLLPGDIVTCDSHVMIFVNKDSSGNYWFIDDGGGGPGTIRGGPSDSVGVRLRTVKIYLINKNNSTFSTNGSHQDSRHYYCYRNKKLAKMDKANGTYIPSGNIG